jgi:hypothetical protein
MEAKITKADVIKARALLAEHKRREELRKRRLSRKVSKSEAKKAVSTVGNYTKQQGKKILKAGWEKAKKITVNYPRTLKG